MQLAKDNVCSVAPEDFRHSLLNAAHFVGVTENEITSLKRLLLSITSGDATPFYGRMADTVTVTERLCLCRQSVTILAPDGFDSCHVAVSLASRCERRFQPLLIR